MLDNKEILNKILLGGIDLIYKDICKKGDIYIENSHEEPSSIKYLIIEEVDNLKIQVAYCEYVVRRTNNGYSDYTAYQKGIIFIDPTEFKQKYCKFSQKQLNTLKETFKYQFVKDHTIQIPEQGSPMTVDYAKSLIGIDPYSGGYTIKSK